MSHQVAPQITKSRLQKRITPEPKLERGPLRAAAVPTNPTAQSPLPTSSKSAFQPFVFSSIQSPHPQQPSSQLYTLHYPDFTLTSCVPGVEPLGLVFCGMISKGEKVDISQIPVEEISDLMPIVLVNPSVVEQTESLLSLTLLLRVYRKPLSLKLWGRVLLRLTLNFFTQTLTLSVPNCVDHLFHSLKYDSEFL